MANPPWTKEEIGQYEDMRRKELGPMYAAEGISIKEPERRARYLYEKLKPYLAKNNKAILKSITEKKDRPARLRALEDLTVDLFF